MYDFCKSCCDRGNLDKCLSSGCKQHNNWINKELSKEIERLNQTIIDREIEIMNLKLDTKGL